jgi:hypothetical protein
MKKIIIAAALILTSALTALSLNRKESKAEENKVSVEKTNRTNAAAPSETQSLATAD